MPASATAVDDYLKVIYAHTEWQPEPITPLVLAGRLGLAASSVTEMVKKLSAQGLVSHKPYSAIELTRDGTSLALRIVRRHRLIETWLVQRMGYSWDQVHDEAEILEHAMSDRLLDEIDGQLDNPPRDPHGDPIPNRHLVVDRPAAVLLANAEGGRVVRICDRDPELLRQLQRDGVTLDSDVSRASMRSEALHSIWVSVA